MVAALTALYMGHCKVLAHVRPFIEAGGLRSLVALIDHPNLHIASQAMNSLLLITDGAGRMGRVQRYQGATGSRRQRRMLQLQQRKAQLQHI